MRRGVLRVQIARWCPRCKDEVAWRKWKPEGGRAFRRSCLKCGGTTRRIKYARKIAPTPGLQRYREKDKEAMKFWTRLIHRQAPDGLCKRCGQRRPLQAAHCVSRGQRGTTRHDPDNGAPLCGGCHMLVDRDHREKERFFRAYLGDQRYDALMLKRLARGKVDLDLVILDLKRRLT